MHVSTSPVGCDHFLPTPITMATPAASPPMNGEHRLRSENLAFDIDVWYPPLANHTFPSVFLPLTRRDAQAIVAYYNAAWRSLPDDLTTIVAETLLALEDRIDDALQQSFGDGGAFLRLCGRSPKDGEPTDPELRAKIWSNYQATLQRMKMEENTDGHEEDDGNLRVAAIAHTDSWLRVRTGAEAMSLLLTSERVFSDMLDWLQYGEPEQLVLREFSDTFDLSTEFRCYIHHGVLQGISQYDTYAKHSFLQDVSRRRVVIRAVVKEWRKVRDCIDTMDGSYCADFGVDVEQGTAQLIEISPFRRCTGPALFAWQGETKLDLPDRPDVQDDFLVVVLQEPEDGTVSENAAFRVRAKPIPGIGDLVEMNWDMRWSEHRVDTPKPYREIYEHLQVVPGLTNKTTKVLASIHNCWWEEQHVLFVYGTLKRNCHWNSKYMTGARFLGEATTVQAQSLVIGQCGVPYMINLDQDEEAKRVRGELWKLSDELLRGIDEYEGIRKGHYSREEIEVSGVQRGLLWESPNCKAFCYFYAIKPGESDVDASLLRAARISEYTAEEQKTQYKPIHHIQVKQLQYLGEQATT